MARRTACIRGMLVRGGTLSGIGRRANGLIYDCIVPVVAMEIGGDRLVDHSIDLGGLVGDFAAVGCWEELTTTSK